MNWEEAWDRRCTAACFFIYGKNSCNCLYGYELLVMDEKQRDALWSILCV